MNRLADILGQFTLPELSKLLKRTMFSALAVGVVALLAGGLAGYILFGLGVAIGLGLGAANTRVLIRQATEAGASQSRHPVRVLASQSAFRLGAITAVAIGLLVMSRQLGIGTVAGALVFNFGFLVNSIVIILRKGSWA
jgi:hypothetical protein